ncbi:hypothetical protein J7T55_003366 [Diaporthe amygdali]|uniref:uncharacterized protein n=1 Tax=Phomopsis amygdali TaxID=1214568 RepID=UPI0022FE695F|nr:uncharacterized protein J7T55_003366 [Diaporthe amygdali]KAJ0116952.1 hypothetical protein J7T55_003366 [Diaporthe amygdali]
MKAAMFSALWSMTPFLESLYSDIANSSCTRISTASTEQYSKFTQCEPPEYGCGGGHPVKGESKDGELYVCGPTKQWELVQMCDGPDRCWLPDEKNRTNGYCA